MDRRGLETTITAFQARCRGFLLRKEVGLARQDYEAIVREVEGDVCGLVWKGRPIPKPHFIVTGFGVEAGESLGSKWSCEGGQTKGEESLLQEVLSHQGTAAENRVASKPEGGNTKPPYYPSELLQEEHAEDGEVDMASGTKSKVLPKVAGPQQQHQDQAQDRPRTEEELRLHRNSLAMELLWLQQALNSRKKYLLLKQRIGTPEH